MHRMLNLTEFESAITYFSTSTAVVQLYRGQVLVRVPGTGGTSILESYDCCLTA
jgi:hypothetical protein